jgi:hypothetical protein
MLSIRTGGDVVIGKSAEAIILFVSMMMLSACVTTNTQPHATSTTLTTDLNYKMSKRTPMSVFSVEDSVVCLVDFQWADVTKSSGEHSVEWRWYKDGNLVSETKKKQLDFNRSPYTTWTRRSATSLGVGHFTVTTFVDGAIMSTSEFEIK